MEFPLTLLIVAQIQVTVCRFLPKYVLQLQEAINNVHTFYLFMPPLTLSTKEVSLAVASVDSSEVPGRDGLPPLFLKQCASTLALPLTTILNSSLTSGVFPRAWKHASITPIHKSGNLNNVENYRGISILNSLSKVLEKLVQRSLYTAVRHIISAHQHGFVKNRSTVSNLMCFISCVLSAWKNVSKYVDFAKPFDKVPQKLAVEKMKRMGLPERITNWLFSNLTDRTAFVNVHRTKSYHFTVPSGVPEGSILGPLIFVIFINDISDNLESKNLLFADDLELFRTITSSLDRDALQRDVNSLLRWCATFHLCNKWSRNRTLLLY